MKLTKSALIPLLAVGLTTTSTLAHADSTPSAPENLSAALYSGAGGEISWSRSSDDRAVIGYEVTLNGNLVGVFDALSYYDGSLQENTAYAFTVTAIDSAGQRSTTSRVSLGGAPTAVAPVTDANSPLLSSPARLEARVYSSTSAELFWARSATPGLLYEVSLDGNIVTTTDGISFYTSDLSAARSFTYEVTAINSAGRRSSPSTIVVNTASSTAEAVVPSSDNNELPPIQPQDLSMIIYSDTAAEIFWEPADQFRTRILSNEIRRNGEVIAALQGEFLRSFFDFTRVPGEFYSYEVTAISADARESSTISDSDATRPPPVIPITEVQGEDLPVEVSTQLDTAFEIFNGVAFEKVMATMGRLTDRNARSANGLVSSIRSVDGTESFEVFDCPNGGTLRVSPADSETEQRFADEVELNDCAVGAIVFSANARPTLSPETQESISPTEDFRPTTYNIFDIELVDSRDLSTITSQGMHSSRPRGSSLEQSWVGFNVTVERPFNSYSYSNWQAEATDLSTFEGGFQLQVFMVDATGVLSDEVELSQGGVTFNSRESVVPTGVRIRIESDTEELEIDANNGDPSTFTLTSTVGNTATSYTVDFSGNYLFQEPTLEGVDVGF